jgi:putative endonuclease
MLEQTKDAELMTKKDAPSGQRPQTDRRAESADAASEPKAEARKPVSELNAYELGRKGERIAQSYLERRGFKIISTNWRTSYGEADIVCQQDGEIVLVEVKTRLCLGKGRDDMPELAVDGQKQQRYRRMALYYMAEHPEVSSARFDVIAINIVGERLAKLRHLVGAYAWDE